MSDGIDDPYPFESDDDIEIGELDLESVDAFDDDRITVGELVGDTESWRFGHVIVDEAQDLTPMQWRMVMRRVAGRSLTIVGDLAQRSAGPDVSAVPTGSWPDHLPPELAEIRRMDLTINYRSPAEIHALAVEVLARFAPEVAPSRSIRSSGVDPAFRRVDSTDDRDAVVDAEVESLHELVQGQIAVIGLDVVAGGVADADGPDGDGRVRRLRAADTKGLEFDAVVLVEPAEVLAAPGGAALLYIALTRATQRLVVVHADALPDVLAG